MPYQNIKNYMWDAGANPVMGFLRYENKNAFNELVKNNFFKELQAQRPDYIIGMGNYMFQMRVFKEIETTYANNPD